MVKNLKKQVPNFLTLTRALTAPALIWIELTRADVMQFWFLSSLILSDHLDGYLARKLKITGNLGAVLEDIADFIFTISLLITVNLRYKVFGWTAFTLISMAVVGFTFLSKKLSRPFYNTLRSFYRATYPVLFTFVLFDYSFHIGITPVILVILFTLASIIWKKDKIVEYFNKLFSAQF